MSDQNFDRVYKLTVIKAPEIGDIDTPGLRGLSFFENVETITEITQPFQIKAKIEKHLLKIPNQAEITLINLAAGDRDAFVEKPLRIRLEAGYDGDPRLLFLGDLRFGSNKHDRTAWDTKLQLADGGRAYAEARHNRSYAPGTPYLTIISDLCKAFTVQLPPELATFDELRARIPAGEVTTGKAQDELTRILDSFGMEWSFQNERIQIVRVDAVVPGTVRLISQETGMIGAPAIEPPKLRAPKRVGHARHGRRAEPKVPKLKIKHELYPEVTPGESIEVQSRSINGIFRVDVVTHELDFQGADWQTHIEGRSV